MTGGHRNFIMAGGHNNFKVLESQLSGEDDRGLQVNAATTQSAYVKQIAKMLNQASIMASCLWKSVAEKFGGEAAERYTHPNQKSAVLMLIGHSVGFGNIWRFPMMCHEYKPATFMVAYTTCLLVIGIPVFFLEICLGQYVSQGPTYVFANIAPIFAGLGWGMLWMSFLTCIYYIFILSWILYYLYQLMISSIKMDALPWTTCNNTFNTKACFCFEQQTCEMFTNSTACKTSTTSFQEFFDYGVLGKAKNYTACGEPTIEPTSESFGDIQPHLLASLVACWILVAVIIASGTKYRGRILSFTVLCPYVILSFMLIITISVNVMSGSIVLDQFLNNFEVESLSNLKLWVEAGTQVMFSTGIGFGGIITIASYNTLKQNTLRDGFLVPIVNAFTSFMAGIIIFWVLEDMAGKTNVDIKNVLKADNSLPFVTLLRALSLLPCGWNMVWTMLFFIMLFLMGLATQVTWIRVIITAFFDNFNGTRRYKLQVVCVLCIMLCFLGIPMCRENGIKIFDFMKHYSCTPACAALVFLEVIIVCGLFGFKNFMWIVQNLMCVSIPKFVRKYFQVTLCCITPGLLLFVLVGEVFYGEKDEKDFKRCLKNNWITPTNFDCFGWLLMPTYLIIIFGFMVYAIYKHKNYTDYKREWTVLFQHTKDFIPEVKRRESTESEFYKEHGGFTDYVLRF